MFEDWRVHRVPGGTVMLPHRSRIESRETDRLGDVLLLKATIAVDELAVSAPATPDVFRILDNQATSVWDSDARRFLVP